MRTKSHQGDENEVIPAGCWHSPRGKLLSKQDRIRIRLPEGDLVALHRAVDASMSHLDEAREGEERVSFAERLVRLQDQGQTGELTIWRGDLHVLHRALHVAAGHADEDLIRGPDSRAAFFRRLASIRRTAFDAVWDHDDVPQRERERYSDSD
jgi:hypothetical protein